MAKIYRKLYSSTVTVYSIEIPDELFEEYMEEEIELDTIWEEENGDMKEKFEYDREYSQETDYSLSEI